jgi:hypothetical protein
MPQLLPLSIYREHQKGASGKEPALPFKIPEFRGNRAVTGNEALCLERQIRIETRFNGRVISGRSSKVAAAQITGNGRSIDSLCPLFEIESEYLN